MTPSDQRPAEPIAVIGLAGRFPGARNIAAFWENLKNGVDSCATLTDEQLAAAGIPAELRENPAYVKRRPLLDDVPMFDAGFFGYPPHEAARMDPQHRLFLETAWEALEDAGYDAERHPGAIGVFAGQHQSAYLLANLCSSRDFIEEFLGCRPANALTTLLGNDKDFLTSRVAYKLNLRGPAITVQTACSTSLVSVVLACESLRNKQTDVALAGGVAVLLPEHKGHLPLEGGILSPDGVCRSFDERAGGTVFGSGVGVVVLKRLSQALADRDTIHAVIRGAALNNDGGLKFSYAAPAVDGQAAVIRAALEQGGVSPDTISYVEAHGTGTALGDPIEIAALTQAFRSGTQRKQFCAIGSVKTNVGHLDAAAGITGFIKAVLALREKQIPPSLHFEKPNPRIDFASSPFKVVTALTPWTTNGAPRRAGVSAFGVGGTNAHVVLEEAPAPEPVTPSRSTQLFLVSARTPAALDEASSRLGKWLKGAMPAQLPDAAYTLQVGRKEFNYRRMLVCADGAEAGTLLETRPARRVLTQRCDRRDPPVVFLFPGQGSQYAGMGAGLYQDEPVFREAVAVCAGLLREHLELDVTRLLCPTPAELSWAEDKLAQTQYAQPALFTFEYALARLWMSWGIQPSAMLGHSLGEYVAACLAGTFTLGRALEVVAERAKLIEARPAGAMLVVRLPEEEVRPLLGQKLDLAAVNAPQLCVASGPLPAIADLEATLRGRAVATIRLAASHAFHSATMDAVTGPLARRLRRRPLQVPAIPCVSSITGRWLDEAEATNVDYWAQHARRTVRFADALGTLLDEPRVFLEVGPGAALSTLARQHPAKTDDHAIITSLPSVREPEQASLLGALGRLWLNGVRPDWTRFYAREQRRRISLPTYPFERKRHWIEPHTHAFASARAVEPIAATTAERASETVSASAPALTDARSPDGAAPIEVAAEPSVFAPTSTPMIPVSPADHGDRFVAGLQSLFLELSGVEFGPDELDRTFIELGLDSLFLTQARQAVENRFGVRITFRQLQTEAGTLRSLAALLARECPDAPPAAAAVATTVIAEAPAAPATSAKPATLDAAGLEALMQQQLELMRTLQALKSGAGVNGNGATPHVAELNGATDALAPERRAPAGRNPPVVCASGCAEMKLTPVQRAHVEELGDRLARVTSRSKHFAQDSRRLVADPRSLVNYRQAWKELAYQLVAERASGARLWDIDGNEFVDVTMGFGVHLLGHSPQFAIEAMSAQLARGLPLGPQLPLVNEVATQLRELTGFERFAFGNSVAECLVLAVRLARAATGRDKIVYFSQSYHGAGDEVLFRAGPGGKAPVPVSTGIPRAIGQNVIVLDYGAPASLEFLRRSGSEIAAVLVEPVQSRAPGLRPVEFLRELREVTTRAGTRLIFDEALTGFRLHVGGAQAMFGVRADYAVYGKALGGGLPFAVLGGRTGGLDGIDGGLWEFGDNSAPGADVTFAVASFARNPLALAAARATLQHLREAGPGLQEELNRRTDAMVMELNAFLRECAAGFQFANTGSIFRAEIPNNLPGATLLAFELLARGCYYRDVTQAAFLSTAHTAADVRQFVDAFKESVTALQRAEFLPGQPREANRTPAAAAQEGTSATTTAPARTSYPLTAAQREIWLACQFGPEASCAFNEAFALDFRGPLQVDALTGALQDLIARHEVLRATFTADGEQQVIRPELAIPLARTDWSHLGAEERDAHLAAFIAQNMEEPFDLENGPLVRARLLKMGDQEHRLLFTAHHLVCDGETAGILARDLGRHYSARVQNRDCRAEPVAPFGDLAEQQARRAELAPEAKKFWLAQFADVPAPLALPLSRPRTAQGLHHGGVAHLDLDAGLLRALRQLGAKQGGTLFAVLLAAFKVWLLRLAGQEEVVVGVFNSARPHTGRTGTAGHAVNTLPLRSRTALTVPFAEFLAQVNRLVLDAREHADFTYGDLVRSLQLPREPGRSPLIDAVFNYERGADGGAFHDLESALRPIPHAFVHFDLFLNAREHAEKVALELEYRADLFEPEVMQGWFGHFRTLLEGIAAAPDARLSELPLLTAPERRRLIAEWNETASDFPRNACLHELFEARVEASPDAVAVIAGPERVTYGELNRYANRLANHLRSHGVTRETLVGICLERSWRMVAAVLAVLKAGGAYVPLDPTHPAERLDFIRREAQLRAVIVEESLSAQFGEPGSAAEGERLVCLDRNAREIARESAENPGSASEPANLAYVLYTSGSTGRPKGVAIEHRNAVAFVHWAGKTFSRQELDGVLAATTLNFDLSVFELFAPLAQGGKLVLVPNVLALADLPHAGDVRLINTVPSAMAELLRLGAVPESVETVNLAGEPLSVELVDQLYALPHIQRVNDLYGPTETTVYATHAVREAGAPATIGRPLANMQAFILDANFAPVPIGVPGELCLGGEGLARGYLNQPGLTAAKFIRNPFSTDPNARLYRTGDRCRYRSDGAIEFIGRIDHQVKIRGYRIEPGEIECALHLHAAVDECVVVAREDQPGDKRLVAYVVAAATTAAANELPTALREHLMEKVPPYMVPDAVVVLEALPRTPAGKLDRAALPAPSATSEAEVEFVEPSTEVEMSICALWRDLLGIERAGVRDNFFLRGGHSLLAMRLVTRLRETFNIELPVGVVFTAPTVSGLAREVESRLGNTVHADARSLLTTV